VDLSTRQRKVVLSTMLLAVVGLLCHYKTVAGHYPLHGHEKNDETCGIKKLKF